MGELLSGSTVGTGVGVVVPYDFAQDREMWRWVPAPASLYVTRTPFVATPADAGQAMLVSEPDTVARAVQEVLLPGPGVVAYSCTSGSFVGGAAGERALREVVRAAGAPRAVTTAGAVAAACAALGVERIALATPYVEDLTDRLQGFLAAHGVRTVGRHGLGLLGRIWDTSPAEVIGAVRAADHPDAQAVFVSCTNLPTYDVIAGLEAELGKPVLTANQVTMWAALDAVGVAAVGPGQALIEGARTGGGREARPTLHKVRVRLPDESGALARLTAAVADAGGNILALSVHGQDSRSVVDEMLVGGTAPAGELSRVIRRRLRSTDPDAVQVVVADPHELVDVPTRALDLAAGAAAPQDVLHGLRDLLHADAVAPADADPDPDDGHALAVPAPPGAPPVVLRREWAPFTLTERARAEAFLRATAGPPQREVHHLMRQDGSTLVAGPATGDEIVELAALLAACRADGSGPATEPSAAGLYVLLRPRGGTCLLARTPGGTLVGAASRGRPDGPAPTILVHPDHRDDRLTGWLRDTVGAGRAAECS